MKVEEDVNETLDKIAKMKGINRAEASRMVLSVYSEIHLKMLEDARAAACNAIRRSKNEKNIK